jgi:hypothetical protein
MANSTWPSLITNALGMFGEKYLKYCRNLLDSLRCVS